VPLVAALFQRGAFGDDDTANTALALAIYGLGLPAFVLQKVLQPLYFAREDTRRPFHFALAALAINAVLAIGLSPVIGFIAAALGTTVAGWGMVVLLWRGSRSFGEVAEIDARLRLRLPRILAAAVAMGVLLWAFAATAGGMFVSPGWKAPGLALLVALGTVGYFGIGHLIGAFRMADLRGALRR
jgi:putative peptidoglycan lipid II flippase